MTRRSLLTAALLGSLFVPCLPVFTQGPQSPAELPDAVEAINHARVVTRILCITAHPDDEPASLLTYLSRGLGADVALLSITRGEGGQNALGPEEGAQLAVLRSHELLAATKIYGIRLFFTRAPDTGFVKTVEAAEHVWGDTALADMVHVIRYFQPHIVINSWGGVHTGHGHHQTSGILAPQAVAAAADASKYPGDLAPWHVDQVLERYRGEGEKGWAPQVDEISPLWGRTYAEIGREGDYQHRTQGIAGFLTGAGPRFSVNLVDEQGATPDPAHFAEPVTALAQRYPILAAARGQLDRADQFIADARRQALALVWPGAARSLAVAGKEINDALQNCSSAQGNAPAAEIRQCRTELVQVKERIEWAIQLAAALHLEAQASRREAVPGETITITTSERHREGTLDSVGRAQLQLPAGWKAEEKSVEKGASGSTQFVVSVPADAQSRFGPNDWMFPAPSPLIRAQIHASVTGYNFTISAAATEIRASSTQVEYLPLQIVPRVTISLEPREMLVPPSRRGQTLEEVARVHYYGSAPAQIEVGLANTPGGWPIIPSVALKFEGPGDQLARLKIVVPRDASAATLSLRANAKLDGQQLAESVEPLPTLPSWLWTEPAAVTLCVPDLIVPEHLRVGYVAAENDPIPEILREAGVSVDLLDPIALAFNDLSGYDAIAVGIRAYELRSDLASSNHRLLEYAAAGGTLVVQYQRSVDWNRILPAPYPAKVGVPTLRITDRNSPVRVLAPQSPLLNFPNKIAAGDFEGWVQERGLYFLGDLDSRYTAILALRDPGEQDLTGGLVAAPVGKGTYIYTGLSFFRQLPAGVQGPLRLFVNLVSQSRGPKSS